MTFHEFITSDAFLGILMLVVFVTTIVILIGRLFKMKP